MSFALSPNPTADTTQPPIPSTTPEHSNTMANTSQLRVVNDDNIVAASMSQAAVISAQAYLHQYFTMHSTI